MAELDAETAKAICDSVTPVLAQQFGPNVECFDVSSDLESWDLEARDRVTGAVLAKISHVTTTSEDQARAARTATSYFWNDLEREMAELGLRGIYVTYSPDELPSRRDERVVIAKALALRIRDHLALGTPILPDRLEEIAAGRYPFKDPLLTAFDDVGVVRTGKDEPARVGVVGLDGYRVPTLAEEIFPTIEKKLKKHGPRASELVILVEVFHADSSADEILEAVKLVTDTHRRFLSGYVARRRGSRYDVARIW